MVTSFRAGASDRQYGTGLSAVLFIRREYRLRHKEIITQGRFYTIVEAGTFLLYQTVRWDRKVKMILTYVANCPIIIDISQNKVRQRRRRRHMARPYKARRIYSVPAIDTFVL